jgi:hypothetical protein
VTQPNLIGLDDKIAATAGGTAGDELYSRAKRSVLLIAHRSIIRALPAWAAFSAACRADGGEMRELARQMEAARLNPARPPQSQQGASGRGWASRAAGGGRWGAGGRGDRFGGRARGFGW